MVIDREEGTISFDGEERLRMSDVLEPTLNNSLNMNRIVTVKLSDETISAVEVNVPFEASLDVNNSCGIKAYN